MRTYTGSYPLLSLVPATSAQARLSGPRPADRGGGGQGEGGMDLGFGDAPVREAGSLDSLRHSSVSWGRTGRSAGPDCPGCCLNVMSSLASVSSCSVRW